MCKRQVELTDRASEGANKRCIGGSDENRKRRDATKEKEIQTREAASLTIPCAFSCPAVINPMQKFAKLNFSSLGALEFEFFRVASRSCGEKRSVSQWEGAGACKKCVTEDDGRRMYFAQKFALFAFASSSHPRARARAR